RRHRSRRGTRSRDPQGGLRPLRRLLDAQVAREAGQTGGHDGRSERRMILEPVQPFRSHHVTFKPAVEAWELRAYRHLRRRIFCDEQNLFEVDDGDAVDDRATPLVALSNVSGMPDGVVGVVRIWEASPGQWWGGRLGTHPSHRGD